jgi:hypothetical protein
MLKVITSTKKLRNLLEFVNHNKLGQRLFIEELEYKTPTHTKKGLAHVRVAEDNQLPQNTSQLCSFKSPPISLAEIGY